MKEPQILEVWKGQSTFFWLVCGVSRYDSGLFGNIFLLASVLGMFWASICLVAAVKELLKMRLSFATNSHLWFRIMQAWSCFKMALGLCQEGLGEHRKAWGRTEGPGAGWEGLGWWKGS